MSRRQHVLPGIDVSTTKQRIKRAADARRRTAFRAEFYKNSGTRNRSVASAHPGENGRRRSSPRFPLWVTLSGFGVLLCLIAIGGSSAMIWLRRLGAVFGVHWIGD